MLRVSGATKNKNTIPSTEEVKISALTNNALSFKTLKVCENEFEDPSARESVYRLC